MPDHITITPSGPIHASIRPPGSKSITNRALVCASLANGTSKLSGALDSEDTQVMIQGLRDLGIQIDCDTAKEQTWVTGCGGEVPAQQADLFVENSGTTIRFLTAVVALGQGQYRLDGIARMRERPIGDLLDALNQLGAKATTESGNDCPPVIVQSSGLVGGSISMKGDVSSQFLSGLLMAAPYARAPMVLTIDSPLVSRPYVRMTLKVMASFGVAVDWEENDRFTVSPGRYAPCNYAVEPDASAASYFWGAAAITGGAVEVQGLTRDALQGDVQFCECLRKMGCEVDYLDDSIRVTGKPLHGIETNMNEISDTVQTLAAVATFADGPTTITGVAHIRHKETDRIGNLAIEMRKFGMKVDEFEDGLRIVPQGIHGATIDTYNDHRMAMSLALIGLKTPGVIVNNPQCTQKTYPGFFNDLHNIIVPAR